MSFYLPFSRLRFAMIILRKKLDFFTLRASSIHRLAALSWVRGIRNTASPMNALPGDA
jgi:hypothetical protein